MKHELLMPEHPTYTELPKVLGREQDGGKKAKEEVFYSELFSDQKLLSQCNKFPSPAPASAQ